MAFLRISPRRLFWSIMAAALLWCAAGNHFDRDYLHPRGWLSIQSSLGYPFKLLLTPASWTVSLVQGVFSGTLSRVAPRASGPESVEELRQNNRNLQNENAQLKAMVQEGNSRLDAVHNLLMASIEPEDVLSATIVGRDPGPGAHLLTLDKGTMDGVHAGDAVLAPLDQVCLLGKVTQVFQKNCDVHLFSDTGMSARVQVIRPQLNGDAAHPSVLADTVLNREPSLLVGKGTYMESEDLSIQLDIRPRDLVRLADSDWPRKVQNMIIGEVASAIPRPDQPLRYRVRVNPRIPITTQHTVMILVRN